MDEALVTFGGTCPRCFAHIPGEEAATDPGEDVKAALDASDRARSRRRALLPILVAAPVVLAVVGAAVWFATRPAPEVALLDLDALDGIYMPDIVAATDEAPAEAAPSPPAPEVAGPSVAASRLLARPSTELTPGVRAHDLGEAVAAHRGDDALRPRAAGAVAGPSSRDGALSTGGAAGGTLDFGLDVTNSRKAGVLEDPAAIRQMIAERMSGQMQQLNSCYERQLKVEPGLTGRWRIRYVVAADGTVRDAAAEGLDGPNPDFERCMTDIVTRWRFGRIIQDQPVQRTVSFRPL